MRKRTVVALLLSYLALGLATVIRMAGPSSAISDARKKSAELRVGMSEAEVEAVLGAAPGFKDKLYGSWMEDTHHYATIHPRDCPKPGPGQKLYDWHQWEFGSRGAWGFESYYVGALLDGGRVVSFWSGEDRGNVADRWLKQAGGRLSFKTTNSSNYRHGPAQAKRPSD